VAVDQREELIAKVKAQVEKERAEKAAKLRREQEAMSYTKGGSEPVKEDSGEKKQQKYKTLSAEDLARIEEKKKRKYAEEHGMTYEEYLAEEKRKEEELAAKFKVPEKKKEEKKEEPEEEEFLDDAPTEVLTGGGGLGGWFN